MTATPFPLPRIYRQTGVLVGNGGAAYGPFDFKIFDIEDVKVFVRLPGEMLFVEQAAAVAKVSGLPLDSFTVTLPFAVPNTAQFVVAGLRLPERSAGIRKGSQISPDALEKELSKIAATEQELRRDVDRSLKAEFGSDPQVLPAPQNGAVLGWADNKLVNVPTPAIPLPALGQPVNYHMFDVDDTGTLSAVAAIRAAFAYAALTGAEVRPLPGRYLIDQTIVVPEGLEHFAPKKCVYLNRQLAPANPMFINGNVGGLYLERSANSNIKWHGGKIDAQDTLTECLAFAKAENIEIDGVRFENVRYSHFIELNGVATAKVRNCVFKEMTDPNASRSFSEAINIDFAGNQDQFPFFAAGSFDKTVCLNITIEGNTFVNCLVSAGAHGYSIYGDGTAATRSRFIRFANNTHLNNGANTAGIQSDAIHCDGFLGVEIEGEIVDGAKNNAFRLEDVIGASINGGYVSNVSGNAVFVVGDVSDCNSVSVACLTVRTALDVVRAQKADNVQVSGCNGLDLRNGIWFEECEDCGASGNTFEGCGTRVGGTGAGTGRGLYATGVSNRITFAGNTIRNTAEHNVEIVGGQLVKVEGGLLSLPAAGKCNVYINGGASHAIIGTQTNGASLLAIFKLTGSPSSPSIVGNICFSGGTNSISSDAGTTGLFADRNRFAGAAKTIADNGSSTVAGTTNFTT